MTTNGLKETQISNEKYHEFFSLKIDATTSEIKEAYLNKLISIHPQKNLISLKQITPLVINFYKYKKHIMH